MTLKNSSNVNIAATESMTLSSWIPLLLDGALREKCGI
jgi:hypothetical protein